MMIFASGSTNYIKQFGPARLGGLLTPAYRGTAGSYLELGAAWAADNGCFGGLDEAAFVRMLERNKQYAASCKWVAVPDVFNPNDLDNNARATLDSFEKWSSVVASYGYPLALVAQNGLENMLDDIPWNDIVCLFIGGDTAWKLGEGVKLLVTEAKARGKWVHMGRVNTQRRLYHASVIGCDSVDGQGFSRYGKRDLPWALSQCTFYSLGYSQGGVA